MHISEFIPDVRNANKGTKRGAEMIEDSLRKYGAGRSILVDKKGRVIAGNKTLEAAGSIGLEDVLILKTDGKKLVAVQRTDLDLSKDKAAKELAIADNRAAEISLEWDGAALEGLAGEVDLTRFFSNDELNKLLPGGFGGEAEAPEAQIDKAEELQKKWKTARGQIWEIGRHRLMCGDSCAENDNRLLLDGVVPQLAFTSFPYAVGLDYRSYNDTLTNLRELMDAVIPLVTKMTGEGAFFVVNFGDIVSARKELGTDEVCEYPMALEYWPRFRSSGWTLHTRRIWVKPIGATVCPWTASSSRGSTEWEHVWTWKKPGEDRSTRSSASQFGVWHYSKFEYETQVTAVHSGAMPVYLPACVIPIYCMTEGIVWDPFAGSGTTICAAEIRERGCVGMEIDPGYVAVALERMADMGLTPKLTNGKTSEHERKQEAAHPARGRKAVQVQARAKRQSGRASQKDAAIGRLQGTARAAGA